MEFIIATAVCLVCIIGMALMYHYANKKCKHVWLGVLEDGFQYCDFCGMAKKPIDEKYTRKCTHVFVQQLKTNITTTRASGVEGITGYLYVLKCENCGDIQSRKIEVDK